MPTLTVRIEPYEPMLFGDNRSARAGEDHALSAQDPTPATLYGAVGARLAAALGARPTLKAWGPAEPVLGPLARTLEAHAASRAKLCGYALADAGGGAWFPRPLHLRVKRGEAGLAAWDLLAPERPGGGAVTSLGPLARLAAVAGDSRAEEAEEPAWVDEELLAAALGAGELGEGAGHVATAQEFYAGEARIGLALANARNAAVSGRLFARPYRRFAGELLPGGAGWRPCGLLAWFQVLRADERLAGIADGFLGGDRGRARFQVSPGEPLANLRERIAAAAEEESEGFLAYLLTPTPACDRLPELDDHAPVAAALGKPLHVSGWNAVGTAAKPREIRTLVPAGSVFFYDWPPGAGAGERRDLIERLWLHSVAGDLATAGFGRILPGVRRSRP